MFIVRETDGISEEPKKGGTPMGKWNSKPAVSQAEEPQVDQEKDQEDIRTLAYQLFRECGCDGGHDLQHWLEGERRVLERLKGK